MKWSQQAMDIERQAKKVGLDDPDRLRALIGETDDPVRRATLERRLAAVEARASDRAELDALPRDELVNRIPR